MRRRTVVIALVLSLCLLLSGCSSGTLTDASFWQAKYEKVVDRAQELAVQLSVEGLRESYAAFAEPSFVTYTVSRYRYAQLTENAQLAYRCIYNNIFSHPERILIPRLTDDEFTEVFTALRYDNPHLLCLADSASLLTAGLQCFFVPAYAHDFWSCREKCAATVQAAAALLADLPADASAYESVLYAHDRLCEQTRYEEAENAAESSGALLEGTAICAGYAKAFKLLLDMLGMESCPVTGVVEDNGTDSVSHMWLAVRVDGLWYHCDITWDDPVSEDGSQTVDHTYFCVTDEAIRRNHYEIEMPPGIVCNSTDASYFVRGDLVCSALDFREKVRAGVLDAVRNGKANAAFLCDSNETLSLAQQALLTEGEIYAILEEAAVYNERLSVSRVSYTASETTEQLKILFVFDE